MKISDQLLQPMLDRIEQEYKELLAEVSSLYVDDAAELRIFISKKLRQLQMVRVTLVYMGQDVGTEQGQQQENLRGTLRQHKLELRFARRRFHRQLGNQERFQLKTGSESKVPVFAHS